jgi:catechol 2,3-dioxygenase-like lactoylglutathione lyase family enzyme
MQIHSRIIEFIHELFYRSGRALKRLVLARSCVHSTGRAPSCLTTETKEIAMNFKFHHMNICTDNLPRLTKFYRTLFDLGTIADKEHTVVSGIREDRAYTGKVDFLTDGDIEFHWSERDLETGFKMKKYVNPMGHGHFCFRTDDIKGFMRRCDELGIKYADYGCWAIPGWYQVFLYDPDGHCIEVHQPNVFS